MLENDGLISLYGDKRIYGRNITVSNSEGSIHSRCMPSDKIVKISCSFKNILALTDKGGLYVIGPNDDKHYRSSDTRKFNHQKRPNEETDAVTEFDLGADFHVYVTKSGKAYATGSSFLKILGVKEDNVKYHLLDFDEGVRPVKPVCSIL